MRRKTERLNDVTNYLILSFFHSYRVSVTGHQGMSPLGISVAHDQLSSWQIFGVEFVLTFLVVFTVFATLDPNRKSLGSDSLSIGIAYLVCSLTGVYIISNAQTKSI